LKKKVLITGGGTGGHVFPAIAIANEIQNLYPETTFLFVGAQGKLEMKKVPLAGYEIIGLKIAGFPRKRNLSFPFKLISSLLKLFIALIKSYFILQKFKPDVCVGVGGYASGPVLKVAGILNIPYVLQEQNSYPGITNKLLAKKAHKICVAFNKMEKYFPIEKIELTGNPIRKKIVETKLSKREAAEVFNLNPELKTVFITGGSLGADAINQAIESKLNLIKENKIQLIWQTGKNYLSKYEHYKNDQILITDFIEDMPAAYAMADLIVSRAGGTISELCIIGKPTILLPSPNVAEDHQTKNVENLVERNATILIKDINAKDQLVLKIIELLENFALSKQLAENIKRLEKPNARKNIANIVMNL